MNSNREMRILTAWAGKHQAQPACVARCQHATCGVGWYGLAGPCLGAYGATMAENESDPDLILPEDVGKVRSYYTNNMKVRTSAWDVTIHASYDRPIGATGEKYTPEPLLNLTMSVPIAKVLIGLLQSQILAYEKQVGPVPVPTKKT